MFMEECLWTDAPIILGSSQDLEEREADQWATELTGIQLLNHLSWEDTPKDNQRLESGVEKEIRHLVGGGRPFTGWVREFLLQRFDSSLMDSVRVHTGPDAARLAVKVNARAFAVRNHLVFGAGQFAPETRAGLWLLAHELAHVEQARRNRDVRELCVRRLLELKGTYPDLVQFLNEMLAGFYEVRSKKVTNGAAGIEIRKKGSQEPEGSTLILASTLKKLILDSETTTITVVKEHPRIFAGAHILKTIDVSDFVNLQSGWKVEVFSNGGWDKTSTVRSASKPFDQQRTKDYIVTVLCHELWEQYQYQVVHQLKLPALGAQAKQGLSKQEQLGLRLDKAFERDHRYALDLERMTLGTESSRVYDKHLNPGHRDGKTRRGNSLVVKNYDLKNGKTETFELRFSRGNLVSLKRYSFKGFNAKDHLDVRKAVKQGFYRIFPGETLSSLARVLGSTVFEIASLNLGMKFYKGQVLRYPLISLAGFGVIPPGSVVASHEESVAEIVSEISKGRILPSNVHLSSYGMNILDILLEKNPQAKLKGDQLIVIPTTAKKAWH